MCHISQFLRTHIVSKCRSEILLLSLRIKNVFEGWDIVFIEFARGKRREINASEKHFLILCFCVVRLDEKEGLTCRPAIRRSILSSLETQSFLSCKWQKLSIVPRPPRGIFEHQIASPFTRSAFRFIFPPLKIHLTVYISRNVFIRSVKNIFQV